MQCSGVAKQFGIKEMCLLHENSFVVLSLCTLLCNGAWEILTMLFNSKTALILRAVKYRKLPALHLLKQAEM